VLQRIPGGSFRFFAIASGPIRSVRAGSALGRAPESWSPAFSPAGRRLAYASCSDLAYRSVCHVQVVDLDTAIAPVGSPKRLTRDSAWTINGLAWTRDGKDVIYSAHQGSLVQLWRADAAGARPAERVEVAGPGVIFQVIAPVGQRLAYTHATEDVDIYRSIRRAPDGRSRVRRLRTACRTSRRTDAASRSGRPARRTRSKCGCPISTARQPNG
jgi:Tol biopolymer transport system component